MRDVLFLTNFSDACFRATRAVAQMADEVDGRLTILYARDPERESKQSTVEKLYGFFPEADHFRGTRRIVAEGDLLTAVAKESSRGLDYVIAPVPIRFGLPRVAHQSTRANVLLKHQTQVWTTGRNTVPVKLGAPARNVACWLDAPSGDNHHVRRACDYAAEVGARLHLLHVIPTMDEGTITESPMPLNETEVMNLVPYVARRLHTEIHVEPGEDRQTLVKMLRACDADVLFLNERQSVQRRLFGIAMSGIVQLAPCPTISVAPRMRS
jgi:nucleotide-binding universal stress UspA family protein